MYTILVVEDDDVCRQLLCEIIRQQSSWSVEAAAHGGEAAEFFGRCRYDAILLDIEMPVMNGYETVALLRRQELTQGGHTPVIALTGNDSRAAKAHCLAAGMDDYLVKPVWGDDLFAVLQRYLLPDGVNETGSLPGAGAPA